MPMPRPLTALVPLLAACGAEVPCTATWTEGQLLIEQLDLPASSTGEAALVIAPDGQSLLVDVGNDSHSDEVAAALHRHGVAAVDHVVLTHDDQDHVGGIEDLPTHGAEPLRWDNLDVPHELDLGGASLTLFLADGVLATDSGVVELAVDLEGEDNARSVAGVLRYGDFHYLFAGDLTGGGKGTPDVEGAVAARAGQLPWVPSGGVDVLHVNHHGISSSTSAAWADWLRPTVAVVGANKLYLDAPSPEALDALAPWVDAVWVTRKGRLGNRDGRTHVARGPVTVVVEEGGNFEVCGSSYRARGGTH